MQVLSYKRGRKYKDSYDYLNPMVMSKLPQIIIVYVVTFWRGDVLEVLKRSELRARVVLRDRSNSGRQNGTQLETQ